MKLFKTHLFIAIAAFALLFTACEPESISPEEKSIDQKVLDGKKAVPKSASNLQIRMYFDDGSTELCDMKVVSYDFNDSRKTFSRSRKVTGILLKASANVSVGFFIPGFPGGVYIGLKKGETRGYTRGEVNGLFKLFGNRRDIDTVRARLL